VIRSRFPPTAAPGGFAAGGTSGEEAPAPAPKAKGGPATPASKLLASAPDLERPGGLRSFVEQVIQEEREERVREEERRVEEEKRQWSELTEGPYGKMNLRVNVLSRRLGLDERQEQRYFQVLTEYSAHLDEASRGLDKQNPESVRSFEERRKAIREEFEAVVLEGLTPDQAREYRALPDFARSPGQSNTKEMAILWAKRG
jgi:hypothetical protein